MNISSNFTTQNGLPRLLTPSEVSEILGISVATLATWRCTQRYNLPFRKLGKKVMYHWVDVEQYIDDCLVTAA